MKLAIGYHAHVLRIAITGLSALSLLLCAAITAIWARSYWAEDEICLHRVAVESNAGQVAVRRHSSVGFCWPRHMLVFGHLNDINTSSGLGTSASPVLDRPEYHFTVGHRPPNSTLGKILAEPEHSYLGVFRVLSARRPGLFALFLGVPFWEAAVLFAVMPLLWSIARMRERRHRRRDGLCTTCGYDLRATRERCPECGTPVPKKAEGAA